jgi:hypothetical protein
MIGLCLVAEEEICRLLDFDNLRSNHYFVRAVSEWLKWCSHFWEWGLSSNARNPLSHYASEGLRHHLMNVHLFVHT